LKGGLFFLITIVIGRGLGSVSPVQQDEAFLIAASVAMLVTYPIGPLPKGDHLKRLTLYFVLILGAYLFGFKIPRLFSSLVNYRLGVFVCLVMYSSCYWFFLKPKLEWLK